MSGASRILNNVESHQRGHRPPLVPVDRRIPMPFHAVLLLHQRETIFGEANIALLVGAILGPFATKAVNPNIWTHFDIVVLEFSRVVLIIQCFAVALELPKNYISRHWRSLFWVVGPVVIWGWMVCSLLVWFMAPHLSWKQSLAIASCFNAIDPVLAATIVGRSRFAKRIPKHIRDLLLAEWASNDVTTSVSTGLSILLTRYPGPASGMAKSLILYTIGYQIFLAGFIGLVIGYLAQQALRYAEKKNSTDRDSFLAFYIMVALFCAGLGTIIGVDDVLLAFCAGYAFDKKGWFREKTEDSHVSGTVDLLLNLTFFVFLGAMIPWRSFNQPSLHISAWRLVIGTLLIFLVRRIPAVLFLKSVIPDIKTWREALFYGHFGPIGVGAIFSTALISSEPGRTGVVGNLLAISPNDPMHTSLWPIVTFVVLCSSIVHGSSVPLFVLGKAINALTITVSYTEGSETGPSWLNRLPRVSSQSRSMAKSFDSAHSIENVLPDFTIPGNFLRRQKEENNNFERGSRSSSLIPRRRRKAWDSHPSSGGPVSWSALYQTRGSNAATAGCPDDAGPSSSGAGLKPAAGDIDLEHGVKLSRYKKDAASQTEHTLGSSESSSNNNENFGKNRKTAPVVAYQFGNTIIIEDEDGEVVKKHELPSLAVTPKRQDIKDRMGFSLRHNKRWTKEDFLNEIRTLDPGARAIETPPTDVVHVQSTVPPTVIPPDYGQETAAERRRREAALGIRGHEGDSDTSDEGEIIRGKASKILAEVPIVSTLVVSDVEGSSAITVLEPLAEAAASSLNHLSSLERPKSCLRPPSPSSRTSIASVEDGNLSEHSSWQMEDVSSSSQRGRSPKGKAKAVMFDV